MVLEAFHLTPIIAAGYAVRGILFLEEAAKRVIHRPALRGSIVAHATTREVKTLFACRVLELHQMDIIHMVLSTVRAVQIQHNLVIGLAILAILSAPPLHLGFALLVTLQIAKLASFATCPHVAIFLMRSAYLVIIGPVSAIIPDMAFLTM